MYHDDQNSNSGPYPTNGSHYDVGDHNPGPARKGRDVACGSVTPHVNASLSGESPEQRDRPAECIVSCPLAHLTGSAGPPVSAPGS